MRQIIHICFPQISNKINFKRHIKIALFVGTILNLINQFDNITKLNFEHSNLFRALITYSVPFLVSVYSAATFNNQEDKK